MASSQMRSRFIKNVQDAVIRNERGRFRDTSSFITELNKQIDDNMRVLTLNLIKLSRELRENPDDLGLAYRKQWVQTLAENLKTVRTELTSAVVGESMEHFIKTYSTTFDNNIRAFGLEGAFAIPPRKAIVEAVNYPFAGAMWSDRVWTNTNNITTDLQTLITRALMTGDSSVNIAKLIDRGIIKAEQNIKYVTERIVRTETARIRYTADRKFYEEIGLEEVEFCAILDSKTSEACRGYNGEIFKVGQEPKIPVHPHCRSTYLPVVPERDIEEWLEDIRNAKAIDRANQEATEQRKPAKKPTTKKATTKKTGTKKATTKKEKTYEKGKKVFENFGSHTKDTLLEARAKYEAYKETLPRPYHKILDKEMATIDKILKKAKDGDIIVGDSQGWYNLPNNGGELHTYKYSIYNAYNEGKFYVARTSKIPNDEYEDIIKVMHELIESNPRLEGIKLNIDNSVIKKSGRSYTLGNYSPLGDVMNLGTFDKYKTTYEKLGMSKDGADVFYSTLVHELGHRNHNFTSEDKMEGLTLNAEQWELWQKTIDPYYEQYRVNKEPISWGRFNYPINAQDHYRGNDKKHFYQEMWAESHAVLFNTKDEKRDDEIKKLNEYFPDIERVMKELLNSK